MRINQSFPRVGPVRGKNRKNRFSKESQSVIESLDRTSFFLNRENLYLYDTKQSMKRVINQNRRFFNLRSRLESSFGVARRKLN